VRVYPGPTGPFCPEGFLFFLGTDEIRNPGP
jgi:hypothetical protein